MGRRRQIADSNIPAIEVFAVRNWGITVPEICTMFHVSRWSAACFVLHCIALGYLVRTKRRRPRQDLYEHPRLGGFVYRLGPSSQYFGAYYGHNKILDN